MLDHPALKPLKSFLKQTARPVVLRIDTLLGHRRAARRGHAVHYSGNLFDRFRGLEVVFDRCPGASVLDIGACEGLIAYECARRGAKVVHGFEIDGPLVEFARRLFRNVPVESVFEQQDFSLGFGDFVRRHRALLRDRYDIVLYLGVHHHLKRQMPADLLAEVVDGLLARTGELFAIRTDLLPEVDGTIRAAGFEGVSELPGDEAVGRLAIYRRVGVS